VSTTQPTDESARRARPAGIIGIVIVGLVLAAAVIGLGSALGGESGDGTAVDKAQPIVAGVVVAPGQELTGGNSSLPPLALITSSAVPPAIAGLPAAQQAARYAAMAGNDPALLVKLGAAYQRAGDPDGAEAAYRRALAADPNSLEAKIGLALADGSRSDTGLKAAGEKLAVFTSEYPNSQVAWFNRGWVDAYLRDAKGSIAAWERTVAINPKSSLGKTAAGLLARIARARKASTTG
jgi:tetratricopeptide (TPR) repeat protein